MKLLSLFMRLARLTAHSGDDVIADRTNGVPVVIYRRGGDVVTLQGETELEAWLREQEGCDSDDD